MAKIPKQRGSGSFGGDGHRANKGAFRNSGGNVKPPGDSWFPCGVVAFLAGLTGLTGIGTAVFNQFT